MEKGLKPPLLVDIALLGVTILLVMFSLVMIYSTTGTVSLEKFNDPLFYVKRQSVAVLLGAIVLLIVSRFRVNFLARISPYCIFFAIGLLLLTYLPGLSHSSGGAQRWINLPFFKFQPAELVKVLFVIFIAGYFSRKEEKLGSFFYGIILPLVYVALIAGMLLMQPDFGSSAIIALVTVAMALAAGVRIRHLIYSALPLLAAVTVLIIQSPYRLKRVLAFLSPDTDLLGRGYQLTQSLIAVGSGQFAGVGLGDSQQKLFFLPAAHTDFIFAVVSEELGFIGALVLILMFIVFLWRGLKIAERLTNDLFAYTLTVGMTLLIVLPAFLNVGVVIGLLPTKGLVLPLIGYGGSSMICSLLAVGFILAGARHCYRYAA